MDSIYQDIASRTGGNVYIGVVGPVRTGKSTLIKRLMELLVIPGISDPYRRERARDELPQSGSGKTIMTAEPKFVPEEAVEVSPDGLSRLRVRFIDTVGYLIPGAAGAEEEGKPRLVTTPWFDQEIPMTQAAELGTKKVMEHHASIGLVVTTDGSVTDIPRADYVSAEEAAIRDMAATGKPFLVILNSRNPAGAQAQSLSRELGEKFGIAPMVLDCQALEEQDIRSLLKQLLEAFPVREVQIHLPRWLDALEESHPVKAALCQGLLERGEQIATLGQAQGVLETMNELPEVRDISLGKLDLAQGRVSCTIALPEELYYGVLSSKAGLPIENDGQLLSLLMELSNVKREYDRIADALAAVNATGYGVVLPQPGEITLEKPEVIKKGGAYGLRLKAGAPSLHLVRVDVDTEISPMVGDEAQSRELIQRLSSQDPEALGSSNIFGKSVSDLLQEGLTAKLVQMPQEVRSKFQLTLSRIVNEGASGLICLIL